MTLKSRLCEHNGMINLDGHIYISSISNAQPVHCTRCGSIAATQGKHFYYISFYFVGVIIHFRLQ